MDKPIHYVNREAYLWYIVWRTCFYEDHSAYLPKFHAPIHAIYHRYNELSLRFRLVVDELSPSQFVEAIQNLRETQNVFLSSYWDVVPSKRRRKNTSTAGRAAKDPVLCCVANSHWASNYELLLYRSIRRGSLECKIVNGKPVFGTGEEGSSRGDKEEEISFDTGETLIEDPVTENPPSASAAAAAPSQTEEYRETLEWLKRVDERFGDTFLVPSVDTVKTKQRSVEREPRPDKVTVVISRKVSQLHHHLEREAIVRQIETFTYPPLSE
jgi:hypothetical protein